VPLKEKKTSLPYNEESRKGKVSGNQSGRNSVSDRGEEEGEGFTIISTEGGDTLRSQSPGKGRGNRKPPGDPEGSTPSKKKTFFEAGEEREKTPTRRRKRDGCHLEKEDALEEVEVRHSPANCTGEGKKKKRSRSRRRAKAEIQGREKKAFFNS